MATVILPAQAGRMPGLDSIRGIACLMVLVGHSTMTNDTGKRLTGIYAALINNFALPGVDLFFVLSGFLITGILLDSIGRPDYFRRFYIRRALRILPLYYATLLIFFVLLRPVLEPMTGYEKTAAQQGWFWAHMTNWKHAIDGQPPWWWLNHFWTLAIEEQFYFAWPLVVLLTRGRRTLPFICLLIIAASPILRLYFYYSESFWVTFPERLTVTRMDGLAFGALMAWQIRNSGKPDVIRRIRAVGCASAACLIAWYLWPEPCAPLLYSALAGACAWAVLWASDGDGWRWSAPLRWIGQRSYAMYVFHFPIMCALALWWPYGGRLHPIVNHLAFFAVSGFLTGTISELSWRLLELPALNLRRLFEPKAPESAKSIQEDDAGKSPVA